MQKLTCAVLCTHSSEVQMQLELRFDPVMGQLGIVFFPVEMIPQFFHHFEQTSIPFTFADWLAEWRWVETQSIDFLLFCVFLFIYNRRWNCGDS